jgi:hypothetical protein
MNGWVFRMAEPKDAEAFAKWVECNPLIDPKDVTASAKKVNPTVLYFVAEKDGVAIAFAPLYLSAIVAHLAFSPEARASEKLQAMDVLKDGTMAFMVQFGIREIQTLSKPDYGVAKWALANGFEQDPRSVFRLDLNKEMVEAS